ncbi:phage holin [Lysinibacillus fusiformis]
MKHFSLLGIIIDPTTKGSSEQALNYDKPKDDK